MKRLLLILAILSTAAVVALIAVNLRVSSYGEGRIYRSVDSAPSGYPVAIVLGARVWEGGVPSNTLHDRVVTGVELYKAAKAGKLLMSGGGEEPTVMRDLAVNLGVPPSDIALDTLGLRTYETCARARQFFQVDKALIVTQDYHLPRTLYLCRSMGIDAVGVDAKRRDYDGEGWYWFREYFSRVAAVYDVNFRELPPEPEEKQPLLRQ